MIHIAPPPMTAREVAALRARRAELSDQLISAQSRRKQISEELRTAQGANRVGLEQRLIVLDRRIVQLEEDIATTGQQLTDAPAGLESSSVAAATFLGLEAGQVTGISIVFILAVLMPLAIARARHVWKRATSPALPKPEILTSMAHRLERLENALDTVAIEVERIAEGQRFVARVLASGADAAAVGAGQRPADPLRAAPPQAGIARGQG